MKTAEDILKSKFPEIFDLSNKEGKLILEAMEEYAKIKIEEYINSQKLNNGKMEER